MTYYGLIIIDLVINKDPRALKELFAMLQVGKIAKNNKFDKELVKSEANMLITLSVDKSKKHAPPLESFLNNIGLPESDRKKISMILRGENTHKAKLFSDAIAGVFRCLPGEFENDLKNFKKKRLTEKQKFHDSASSIDEVAEGKPQIVPKGKNVEPQLEHKLTFDKLSRELEKPQYIKIKPVFDAVFENPEISDSDLAKICGIHRNTVPKRREELKTIYRKLTD